jgi:hypothetical protein
MKKETFGSPFLCLQLRRYTVGTPSVGANSFAMRAVHPIQIYRLKLSIANKFAPTGKGVTHAYQCITSP